MHFDLTRLDNHRKFPINVIGRDFVVGDIHGCAEDFYTGIHSFGFDPKTDRVFAVGDLIDRGPNSIACLDFLKEPWFVSVVGNHELFMLATVLDDQNRYTWLANGGTWSLDVDKSILQDYCKLIVEKAPIAVTVETEDGPVGICHAESPRDWGDVISPTPEQHTHMLFSRSVALAGDLDYVDPVAAVLGTVHGHTVLPKPRRVKNSLYIDTGLVFGGTLTAVEITPKRSTHYGATSKSH